ncbi:MAG: superinfection immunity protein [Candidatus Gastranaerophilaceae bacterium]
MLFLIFLLTFLLFLSIFGYFLPTFIALIRNKKNTFAIFLVNLFFGMTFVGWVCALIWSLMYEDKDIR